MNAFNFSISNFFQKSHESPGIQPAIPPVQYQPPVQGYYNTLPGQPGYPQHAQYPTSAPVNVVYVSNEPPGGNSSGSFSVMKNAVPSLPICLAVTFMCINFILPGIGEVLRNEAISLVNLILWRLRSLYEICRYAAESLQLYL